MQRRKAKTPSEAPLGRARPARGTDRLSDSAPAAGDLILKFVCLFFRHPGEDRVQISRGYQPSPV